MGCTSSKSDVLTDKGAGANGVSGGNATTSIDISNLPIKTFTMEIPSGCVLDTSPKMEPRTRFWQDFFVCSSP